MKKQLLLALSLACALPFISGCNEEVDLNNVIVSDPTVEPIVKYYENGEVIKVNDPDDPNNSKLTSVSLNKQALSLFYNSKDKTFDSYQLTYSVRPFLAKTEGLIWESSNKDVATVNETGLVTAVSEGLCDITLRNADSTISDVTRVHVIDKRYTTTGAISNRGNEILTEQEKPGFASENILVSETYLSERKTDDGSVIESNSFTQNIWASDVHSYFRITSEENEVKCEGGSNIPYRVDYIFYTTDDYYTYAFKTDGNKRNYMRVDQSSLAGEGKSKFDALSLVIGNFFVAGARIITSQFTLATGADILTDQTAKPDTSKSGRIQSEKGELVFNYSSVAKGILSPEQAEDFDVPSGTYISVTDEISCIWEKNRVSSKNIVETLDFTLGDEKLSEVINVEYSMQHENIELLYPDMSLYSKVDTIFDL